MRMINKFHFFGFTAVSLCFASITHAGMGMGRSMGHAPEITTLAGQIYAGGEVNGTGTSASFVTPNATAVDSSGNVYVADQNANLIRKISSAGVVTTFAGSGSAGSANGVGTAATFHAPAGLAVDSSGNVYVADGLNNMIRVISPAGVVTTLAGSTTSGSTNGTGTGAMFADPQGVAVDSSGNVYVADYENNMIRKITSAGVVTTLAGSTASGSVNGTGTAAKFNLPSGIAVDTSGNVYVADTFNNMIRKITSAGVVTTMAGSTASGSTNGTGTAAKFNHPSGLAVDSSGNVYVADSINSLIREITSASVVTTFAGNTTPGFINGTGTAARFNDPTGLAIDSSGNLYVADALNEAIREITSAAVVTTFAGSGGAGSTDATGTLAYFNSPEGVTADSSGNAYVADSANNKIRKISPAGVVTTLAGSGTGGSGNGTGTGATFYYPGGVTVDSSGNVYVADSGNNMIRKITSAGVVTTLAGTVAGGSANGTGTAAKFTQPEGLAADSAGNIYVADTSNSMIRKITSGGVVTTLAGSTTRGSANGVGTAASFSYPQALAVDSSGNVYVADTANNLIRKITPAGVVTTIAGTGFPSFANGTGTAAGFSGPEGIAVDSSGNVYVADTGNNLIRKITPTAVVTTLAGQGPTPYVPGRARSCLTLDPYSVAVSGKKLYMILSNGIATTTLP